MKKFFEEFKAFAMRGNVLDLAVGVIIGTAFSAITNSLINDILMPLIGIVVGEATFANLTLEIGDAVIHYGAFIQAIFNFIVMAFAVFCIVKLFNAMHKKKDEAPAAPPAPPEPTKEEVLLTEIRDLLAQKK